MELPDDDARGVRFTAEQVEPAQPGIPRRILVSWLAPQGAAAGGPQSLPARGTPGAPRVVPGQIWLALIHI
ncbi:hypothetical protein HGQ98_33460 [Achromobacter ruhlandii]|uniref:Uncharacterized protein n=1 Tax=Achromobacter ruhlandii TaxID=72557 RepID=A0A848NS59_9BURK|nr:hypothetical protein [Achromobacter ruhlandii]NMU94027.1 hypothetical protein [Achromobacter ruhlandii]